MGWLWHGRGCLPAGGGRVYCFLVVIGSFDGMVGVEMVLGVIL